MSTSPRILIADDQPDVLEALRLLIKGEGYQIDTANSPTGILKALEARDYDVVLMDLNSARDTTSGQEGLDLLTRIHSADESLPVVVMTAWGTVHIAVEAMRRGARDSIEKPWDNERLLTILRTQTELGRALRRSNRLEAQNRVLQAEGGPPLIAQASSMQPVLQIIERVGPSDANVLIMGENGSGKGLIAQALHAVSARAARPMAVSARTCCSGGTRLRFPGRRSEPGARTSRRSLGISSRRMYTVIANRSPTSTPPRWRRSSITSGRATCGSSIMSSSAPS